MAQFRTKYVEREMKRWARPDARNFVGSDWRHYRKPSLDAASVFGALRKEISADQARVPESAGESGAWTDEGADTRTEAGHRRDKSRG